MSHHMQVATSFIRTIFKVGKSAQKNADGYHERRVISLHEELINTIVEYQRAKIQGGQQHVQTDPSDQKANRGYLWQCRYV